MAALAISLAIAAAPSLARAVDFQRDIRPILSDVCYECHGPDERARKAKLRLDTREGALSDRGGYAAVVPAQPGKSELIARITASDPDDRMPPPEHPRQLTPKQIELLRQWIAAGAPWAEHWAFKPPVAPPVPAISNQSSVFSVQPADVSSASRANPLNTQPLNTEDSFQPRNPIDHFILVRLAREGLRPAPPADKITLLRRVCFDLTGLPPTPAEVDAFLADRSPDAYEKVVDRLLDSPRFGERMAVDWLDAARYADSNGYFRDAARQAWPWRDWVIRAFNANLPYDQFTVWQLAGDLLPPDPISQTLDPIIATGFNRNHMVTDESGIVDEEYRVEYVADRLETTATVWLGLTVGCARCHDHKYDPISQREYYQLFAFFNSSVGSGHVKEDDPPPTLDVATPEQRAELEHLRAARRQAEAKFNQFAEPLRGPMAAWETTAAAELAPPTQTLAAHVEFEPDLAGQADRRAGAVEKGGHVAYEPGLLGHAAYFDGMQHIELPPGVAFEADQPWTIGLWIKPTGPLNCVLSKVEPTGDRRGFEIVWQKGDLHVNLVHRWVASAIEIKTREPMNRVDWHHVAVSYDGSRRAAGLRVFVNGAEAPVNVVRDTLDGPTGNAEPLRLGRRDDGLGFYGHLDELRVFRRALDLGEVRAWYWSDRLRGILALAPEKRDAKQKTFVLDYYVTRHADAAARAAHHAAAQARKAEENFRATLPKTLVMQEVPKPPPTRLLERGQYDAPGEVVEPGTPAVLPPLRISGSAGGPPAVRRVPAPNADEAHTVADVLTAKAPSTAPETGVLPTRLDFARWLVDPAHPLTARVQVNRLWQQCFGQGLVRTVEDFGSQGEPPAHPELLDWLAVKFIESGWNVKAMLRLFVTSATYRQSSSVEAPARATAQLKGSTAEAASTVRPVARFNASTLQPFNALDSDPDNRLLARGPRFRLPAEMIRDQALAASGLLVHKIGGPSVKPYQPPGLWEAVSYDGELTYEPDRGEGLWRRSVYTFWKRQAPPPAMLTFDGPTRETCVVRRPRTSTPLQALVLLNDETYVEAARALAALALAQPGDAHARLRLAFRRATSRAPDADELAVLRILLQQQHARFAADKEAARQLTRVGVSTRGHELDPAELAAWTVVTQALLNLDEIITRR